MREPSLFSLLKADFNRVCALSKESHKQNYTKIFKVFNPRFFPVIIIRFSYYLYKKPLLRIFSHLLTWINVCLFGIESTPKCKIGPGLVIPHSYGIVIGASIIGKNFTIFQGVTLGAVVADMSFNKNTRPRIGDNVTLGAGSKVIGNITVGKNVVVGANSVVLKNVPSSVVMVGIPAKVVKKAL